MRYFTPARLGQLTHIRKTIGQIDNGLHVASKVYKAVSSVIPESEAKTRVSKAVDDYQALREKVKRAI